MQGLLYVLWLGTEPIKHMGKSLWHLLIFLKLTCRNNTPFLSFCCCQVFILLSFSSLCVSRFKRRSQNEDSCQGFGEVCNEPFAP